jgi:hypothetical protein
VFNMIEEIFAPGRKHTEEEQKRLEQSRVDVDDNDPGRGPIDLASGKVTIRVPAERPAPAAERPAPPAERPAATEQPGTGADIRTA